MLGKETPLAVATRFFTMEGFHLRSLLSTPFFVFTALSTPASFCILKLLGSAGGAADGTLWTLVVMAGVWGTTTTSAGIIGFQRFQGTLPYLVLSPLSPVLTLTPVILSAVLIGAVMGVPESLALCAILGATPSLEPSQLVGCVLVIASCASLAPLIAVPFLYTRNASAFEPIVLVCAWLLSGGLAPVDTFPPVLAAVARLSPLTWAVEQATADALSAVAVAACLLLCVVCALAGRALIVHAVRLSRVTGTLGVV